MRRDETRYLVARTQLYKNPVNSSCQKRNDMQSDPCLSNHAINTTGISVYSQIHQTNTSQTPAMQSSC